MKTDLWGLVECNIFDLYSTRPSVYLSIVACLESLARERSSSAVILSSAASSNFFSRLFIRFIALITYFRYRDYLKFRVGLSYLTSRSLTDSRVFSKNYRSSITISEWKKKRTDPSPVCIWRNREEIQRTETYGVHFEKAARKFLWQWKYSLRTKWLMVLFIGSNQFEPLTMTYSQLLPRPRELWQPSSGRKRSSRRRRVLIAFLRPMRVGYFHRFHYLMLSYWWFIVNSLHG